MVIGKNSRRHVHAMSALCVAAQTTAYSSRTLLIVILSTNRGELAANVDPRTQKCLENDLS
jgi:hypothetical protein